MNKYQKAINKTTRILLLNEECLHGKERTSFYKMRKFVKSANLFKFYLVK